MSVLHSILIDWGDLAIAYIAHSRLTRQYEEKYNFYIMYKCWIKAYLEALLALTALTICQVLINSSRPASFMGIKHEPWSLATNI